MSNNKIKILWSGITGRTGKEAYNIAQNSDQVEIVAGICRNNSDFYNYDQLNDIKEKFDVIVDFSHKDSFYKILNFALKVKKPLIIGTGSLDEEQMKSLEEASHVIPIFKGGNFRFEIKKFVDSVVEYAKSTKDDSIELVETHYKTKHVPSETAKGVAKRVLEETGKIVNIKSFLEYDELINDYRVENIHCRVIGFKGLAEDVFKVAIMMKDQKVDGLYDLDKLLNSK